MALLRCGLRRFRLDWRLLGLVGLTTFYLLPALKTGYFSEDCWHSVGIVGRIVLKQCDSLVDVMISDLGGTLRMGRFFPLTPALIDTVFYFIRDVFFYKTYLIALTILDVVVFYYLIRRLSGNKDFACFASCVTVTLFQFRIFIDPLLAFYGQLQLVIACLLLSLLALDLYLRVRGLGWLVASTLAYLLCTLAYEVTYTFFLLHLLLIVRARRGWSARLMPALPFLGVVGLCGLTTIIVQRQNPSDLYVHKMSFALRPFLSAMVLQPTAALPLGYFFGNRHHVFDQINGFRALCRWVNEPGSIAVALAALALCLACWRRRPLVGRLRTDVALVLCALAVMLIVLPLPLIASSPEHRQHFSFGVGWIVFLIECFGVGLLMATGAWQVPGRGGRGRLDRGISAVFSIGVAILMGVTYRANLEVATRFSAPPGSRHFNEFAAMNGASYHRQRLNLEAALDAGLLDDAPAGSTLDLANLYPFWYEGQFAEYFYAKHTGKFFHIKGRPGTVLKNARTYRIRDVSLGERSGFVVVSRIGIESSGAGHEIRMYVRRPGLKSTVSSPGFFVADSGSAVPPYSSSTDDALPGTELSLIRAGLDWGLFSLRTTNDRVVLDSIRPVFDTDAAQGRQPSTAAQPPPMGESARLRR
jgi:hypothetical protein